jgi:SAM-dependent methyltransferase
MGEDTVGFYNDLAEHYHLIYEDWDRSIEQQAKVLGLLLEEAAQSGSLKVLDCACGIGTQTIGLARRGHVVVALDLSAAAVRRAQREARLRGVEVRFHVSDMRRLSAIPETGFDAVLVGDNSLPHLLSRKDLQDAIEGISRKLRPGGVLLATIRDYDSLLQTRPAIQNPSFYLDNGRRRIVHQVWDWHEDEYTVHLYLTWEAASGWNARHYASRYRALRRQELSSVLETADFHDIHWLLPEVTAFYQPIVIARKRTME